MEQGDTWEIIEKEAGVNRYALIWENGLDEATPLSSLAGQKIYFPKGTRKSGLKSKETPTSSKSNSKTQQSNTKNEETNRADSSPKQLPKEGDKKTAKPAEKKKENNKVVQERSTHNEKPVDVVENEEDNPNGYYYEANSGYYHNHLTEGDGKY